MEELIPDLIEVVEHVAYSHSFRSETSQKRVAELLTGLRSRLLEILEAKRTAAAAAVPTPSAPASTADAAALAAVPGQTSAVPDAAPAMGTVPDPAPVIPQPESPVTGV